MSREGIALLYYENNGQCSSEKPHSEHIRVHERTAPENLRFNFVDRFAFARKYNCGGRSRRGRVLSTTELAPAAHLLIPPKINKSFHRSPMHSWRIKGRRLLSRGATATIPNRVPSAWPLWGILGFFNELALTLIGLQRQLFQGA
jgi:hypothetical protein